MSNAERQRKLQARRKSAEKQLADIKSEGLYLTGAVARDITALRGRAKKDPYILEKLDELTENFRLIYQLFDDKSVSNEDGGR